MKILPLLLCSFLTGRAARKPAAAHLVIGPECVRVASPMKLDSQGHLAKKQKVKFQIDPSCKLAIEKDKSK